jgi:hypothetical protein
MNNAVKNTAEKIKTLLLRSGRLNIISHAAIRINPSKTAGAVDIKIMGNKIMNMTKIKNCFFINEMHDAIKKIYIKLNLEQLKTFTAKGPLSRIKGILE